MPLTEDLYQSLAISDSLTAAIEETTGAPDGFAVDFIRVLVNRKRENSCKGTVYGRVMEKETEKPVVAARVYTGENSVV